MPRKGENIRKRKDGRWEARYEKCRDQNGRIQYGYLYGRTYEAVKKEKSWLFYVRIIFKTLRESVMYFETSVKMDVIHALCCKAQHLCLLRNTS